MRLLVTGAAGMLGRDVVAAAKEAGHEAVGLARAQLDVTDRDAALAAVREHKPDVVVNCAAYTDVDRAESEEEVATAINGEGAGNLAKAAAALRVPIVQISTDYVFDGSATLGYVESDSPAPQSAYGRSKLAGELKVAAYGYRPAIVRTSWVFGPHGRNFVDSMLALAEQRDEVAVVTDQVGCPTYTGDLAQALVEVAQRGTRGLLHIAGGGHCTWNELATEAFRQAGADCRVLASTTAQQGRPAKRPACSILRTERDDIPRLRDWREGLAAHLARREAEVTA